MKGLLFLLLLIFNFNFVHSQCFEITSVFVNSCGPTEGENEMFTFNTNSTAVYVDDITINWPNNNFLNFCQDAGTVASTAALNATILTSCGWLKEPLNDTIPAGSNVLVITSTNISLTDNSFEGLADTMYIIYQCAGNTAGHFANSGVGVRNLLVSVTGTCTSNDLVTYDRNLLVGDDGATVLYDAAGNATYINNGCNAPVTTINADWTFTNGGSYSGEICNNHGIINLTTLLSPSATTGGTWSGPRVTGTNYNPNGYLGVDSVTYSVAGTGTCIESTDSTIVLSVVAPPVITVNVDECDSAFINGTWYTTGQNITVITPANTFYGCNSTTNITLNISTAYQDSSFFEACDSITYKGVTFYVDTILRDTISGSISSGNSCSELFISEYIEGASNNKAIEIYNGTGTTVDLSNYTLERFTNGANTSTSIALSGMLTDGDVFVVYSSAANVDAAIIAVGDLASGSINHNGDDAYALMKNGVIVDIFGNIGCDPGSEWTNLGDGTANNILYRQANYTNGLVSTINPPCDFPTLNTTNWVSLNEDDNFTFLGSHTAHCTTPSSSSCDSIFITNLQVNNPDTVQDSNNPTVICSIGDSAQLVDGSFVYTAGIYNIFAGTNTNGCDLYIQTEVQTSSCGCFFEDINKTLWVRADSLIQNAGTPITAGTADLWGNIVNNSNVPNLNNLTGGGTRTVLPNDPTYNFNSSMNFINAGFGRNGLDNDAVLDPDSGTMFVVSSQSDLSFEFVISTGSTGSCGTNRCSTGFRTSRTEFGNPFNPFNGTQIQNNRNIFGLTGNVNNNFHKNSINGINQINTNINSIPPRTGTVSYSILVGNWPGFSMTGSVAEAIAFNRDLIDDEYVRVETYLAIKYGITLGHHYFASDYDGTIGTIPYVIGNGFDNNIAGIGRDDCFYLEQIKSHSVDSGAIVTMSLTDNGGTYTSPNVFDNNMEFLIWGNNGASTEFNCSTNTPNGYNQLYNRIWSAQQTGTVGTTSIAFDITNANLTGLEAEYALVIDTDGDDMFDDETPITGTFVNNELLFNNVNIDNHTFTLVYSAYVFVTISDFICNDGTYNLFNGTVVTMPGTYIDTINSLSACDSIITTILNGTVCNCSLDLGPDINLCVGDSVILDAGSGYDTYLWQDNSANQIFTANATGEYYCSVYFIDTTNNLVINGDFEQGNSGFITDYDYSSAASPVTCANGNQVWGLVGCENSYSILTSPNQGHSNFQNCNDHTTGTGNMIVVNGTTVPGTKVWCQDIIVNPNTDYNFSAWVTSVENINQSDAAILHFLIDGVQIGANFSPTLQACNWQQFFTTWNSGTNTTIQICIESDVITGNNDYAIDDIFFTPVCEASDTVQVTVMPFPSVDLGNDTTLCESENLILDATTANASYSWQDASALNNFTVTNTGTYWVDVTTNNCTSRDSIEVAVENPMLVVSTDTTICKGDSITLSATGTPNVLWSTNETTNDINVSLNSTAIYTVQGTTAFGCQSVQEQIEVSVQQPIENVVFDVSPGGSINEGESVQISVNGSNINTYSWTPVNESTNTINDSPTQTTTYVVTLSNPPCPDLIDSISIIVIPVIIKTDTLKIPNAFTPNGDGLNDVFRVVNFEDFESYKLLIYNRWGDLIHEEDAYGASWNGTYNGENQNIDTYTYYINAKPLSGNTNIIKTGTLNMFR